MAARMWLGATTLTNGAEPLPSRALWWRPSTTLSALAMESTRSPCFCFISKEEDSGQAHHCINDWDCTREGVEREWAWQVLEAHNVTKEADRLSGWSWVFSLLSPSCIIRVSPMRGLEQTCSSGECPPRQRPANVHTLHLVACPEWKFLTWIFKMYFSVGSWWKMDVRLILKGFSLSIIGLFLASRQLRLLFFFLKCHSHTQAGVVTAHRLLTITF